VTVSINKNESNSDEKKIFWNVIEKNEVNQAEFFDGMRHRFEQTLKNLLSSNAD
jgi:hypothetical protein